MLSQCFATSGKYIRPATLSERAMLSHNEYPHLTRHPLASIPKPNALQVCKNAFTTFVKLSAPSYRR
jgi:hypothetical protein